MLIRHADDADILKIAQMYSNSVIRAYAGIATDEYLATCTVAKCTTQWEQNLADVSLTIRIAESDHAVVGIACCGSSRDEDAEDERVAELQSIYVDPTHWGRGIGSQMCRDALRLLYDAGFAETTLWVLEGNVRARRFYERAGFVADGKAKSAVMGTALTALRYRNRVDDSAPSLISD